MIRTRFEEYNISRDDKYSQVGKAEFLGRATGKPHVYLEEEVSVINCNNISLNFDLEGRLLPAKIGMVSDLPRE